MSSTFVTLAEVLEARGGPLEEHEVWSLLLGSAETLLDLSYKGHNNICNIISPASLLLSATGTLAFKNCAMTDEACAFTAPEMLQGRTISTKLAVEKVIVYSLGMTLYWSVDYHLPQNQPIPLSDSLNCLLLSMCEDMAHRRVNLNTILESCESHHKTSLLPPPNKVIRQLVEDVFHDTGDRSTLTDNTVHLSGRSQMIRERLHGKQGVYHGYTEGSGAAAERQRRLSLDSEPKQGGFHQQKTWSLKNRSSQMPTYQGIQSRIPQGAHHSGRNSSWLSQSTYLHVPCKGEQRHRSPSVSVSESTLNLAHRRAKSLGPEFARMVDEPQIVLELPGSIVSKKGKSCLSQREVSVVMPNEQCVTVRCDIKSRGRDVFDMVVAHANLVEHFYFGLAFLDDDEFFFLDHETKISKVAPDTWKKLATSPFTLFLRVKFFADDVTFILHKLTRHQYYLQLRRDILEDRVHCNEDTAVYLAALALQAEFGDYMDEVYGRNYFQTEHYIPKRVMEKIALPCLREELPRLHANNAQMLPEEAEMEFLKIAQQLPEYGVLFHRVARERKPVIGDLTLGVCAKGIMVYEVKNNSRTLIRRFQWSETDNISTTRRKFTIECSPSGKKHSFLTESSKIAQYLLSLCSAQHKFHSEMTSRQLTTLASDDNIAKYSLCRARHSQIKRLSCSEMVLNNVGLNHGPMDSMSKSCDDLSAKIQQQREANDTPEPRALSELRKPSQSCSPPETFGSPIYRIASNMSLQKQDSEPHSISSMRADTPVRTPPEREIICVTLKKDPKLGFGFIIVGEDNTGKLDLGIFIASVVPDGPADKDGRIRPGGRLISLNKISLEGVTFSAAAAILQNSPDEVEIIVSQPKQELGDSKTSLTTGNLSMMLERGFDSQSTLSAEYRPVMEELEEALSNIMTPKTGRKLHIPVVRILDTQETFSRSSSSSSLRPGELLGVELRKVNGSLGISVAGGINTNIRYGGIYIKSLIPGGAADQDGRIQIGDRLLEVDSCNLRSVTHRQAVECLKKTGEVVSLLLEREPPVVLETCSSSSTMERQKSHSPFSAQSTTTTPLRREITMETSLSVRGKDYSFVSDANTLEVTLKKSPKGLGFSFLITDLRHEGGSVVRIRRLFPGQPAEQCGLLRQGDVILAVNGEPLRGLYYQRVLQLLQGAPPEVKLTICRPLPGQLPDMETNSLSAFSPHAKEHRSRSLDLRVGYISPDFRDMLQQKAMALSQRTEWAGYKPQEPQSQDSEQDKTPSTPSSPSSPPSPDEEPQENAAIQKKVLLNIAPPPTPAVVTLTTPNPVPDTPKESPKLLVSQPELKEDIPSRINSSAFNTSDLTEDVDGSRACFMANGLAILADEEYLTITTTVPSPPSYSTASSKIRSPPVSLTLPALLPLPVLPPPSPPKTTLITAQSPTSAAQPTSDPQASTNNGWDDEEEDDEDPRKDVMKEFELTVTLSKSWSGSFGFTVTRSKLDGCYYIQDILDNPAKSDGRLRPGDRLIMVNGHNVTNVTDEVAMRILRYSSKRLHMVLGRAVQNLLPPPPPDSLQDIIIYKTPSGQMGIKLTGGIGSKWQGIYVQEVVPNSPASEEGSIQPNDRIVYISGKCTLGMTLEDAVKACENASRKVKLKAMRDDQPVTPKGKWNGLFEWKKDKKFFPRFEDFGTSDAEAASDDVKAASENAVRFRQRLSVTSEQESCILQVEFNKPERGGLGFSLAGGINSSNLRVRDICCGSVAEQDGRLRVGDILLEVNGVIVSGLSHSKVVDILRKAEGTVQLTVCRDILPATIRSDSNSSAEANQEHSASCTTRVTSDLQVQEDHLSFQSSQCHGIRMETEQDSRNTTPTCQRCCPSLGVTDMLQGRTDPQKQPLENLTTNMEQSHSDGWSSDDDDDDEDEDTARPSPLETMPHTGQPIVSEVELTSLALISPPKNSQYSGARLKALIQILQNQLDQQELVKEFMALEHLKPLDNCLVGKAPENREKNRYRDILPYDETRVPVGERQDYINASYIRMKVGTEEFFYISSQGPLPSTQDCFWQMVWENKSDVIAMMTKEVERGRVKCHKYWPEKLHVPMETGHYQLILDNYQIQDYFHIKVIRMVEKETGATHFVKHLKFTTWPDHGTPHSSKQLVRFIRYMRAVHSNGPITVHCSAGIGRAGVLICTDVILSLIEKDLTINVSEIVREMRLQRYGMIQTKEQYLFCYKVWLEVLQSILLLHGNQWQSETPS
ncbi:tyrosine-protein phosphatase non-receptor type 13-like isoform X1 [Astyanax mexicanus]|uniref:Tyrosine-protein phosphatase non-receptor type 13-like isoform X1 n=2 Tax=Astyanax mexicanus TaxID=7994 RepID=A0A8T2LWP9_ASTMX|nr:tyrosine-protein phosphatase non-receptor type 13-like isoform X1 [Astyanax mexicanus]